ncbi:hypothetical protein [Rhizobacter sp. OV335]|uniref:hypothetical protein n=1 Tax=Rhizobacter sp. OV335 TaxID=1500264 RepID=UPI0013564CAD|nr:hypothetical protein [Rhizobacter sp. OV335]
MSHPLVTATALAAVLMGCSTVPAPNAALDRARASYRQLETDPKANEFAAPEMTSSRTSCASTRGIAVQRLTTRGFGEAYPADAGPVSAGQSTSSR